MESISTILLIDLALDLSGSWKKLARALGLEDEVERIRGDIENNVAEQAYRMLLTWKQRNGTLATLEVLSEALRKPIVSRTDLAEKYSENYNQISSKAEINLVRQLRSGQISEEDRTSISKDLGKEWLWVGRLLGIKDAELDNLKELHKQLNECSYYMLKTWARTSGDQATYEWLARALLHRAVGKRDIAEKYCLERRQPQSVATGATEGWDVTDSSLSPPESRPPVENPEDEQENKPGVSSSPTDLLGPLSHLEIKEIFGAFFQEKEYLWNHITEYHQNRKKDLLYDLLGKELEDKYV